MVIDIRHNIDRFPLLALTYRTIRSAWVMRHLKPQMTPFGFRLAGREDMQDGSFEPDEIAFIRKTLPKIEVFVDVGANIGYYACLARVCGKYTIAVEPLTENLQYLYANLEANGWNDMEIWPVGVGQRPGLAILYGGGTGASIVKKWAGSSELYRRLIPISTLDILLGDRFAGQRLLIKIDVEGAECEVLRGAVKNLARTPSPIWVMEICLTEHFPNGINPHFEEIFRIFWENGYEARVVGEDNRLVKQNDVERWVKNRERDFGSVSYSFEKLA